MKARYLAQHLEDVDRSAWGRIVVFTGARQTGKTTLVRERYSGYRYISVEDPVMRGQYARLTAGQWHTAYPRAILDEVQKEPSLIESIKSVYDQWGDSRYVLLGSSQLLLLGRVRESLAGRCIIRELYPLTVPELATKDWGERVGESMFQVMLRGGEEPELLPSALMHPRHAEISVAWDHYVRYGGYPALTDEGMSDGERWEWLRTYVRTYLERDVRDLVAMRDLEPYVKLQQYLAFQTGGLLNISGIANEIGVSAKTVKRYIEYLGVSYQAVVLPAWGRNGSRRLVKAGKCHYLDNGVLRAVLHRSSGMPSGNEYESLVVAELYKQARQCGVDAQFYHLRTSDGREVDLLIEVPAGYYAIEVKKTEHAVREDGRHLRGLEEILDKPVLGRYVLSEDVETHDFGDRVVCVNVAMFVGA